MGQVSAHQRALEASLEVIESALEASLEVIDRQILEGEEKVRVLEEKRALLAAVLEGAKKLQAARVDDPPGGGKI